MVKELYRLVSTESILQWSNNNMKMKTQYFKTFYRPFLLIHIIFNGKTDDYRITLGIGLYTYN